MTLSYSSTSFENDSDFRPNRAVLPQIQVMPLNSLRISLADYVQLSLQADSYSKPAIRHPYHHVKGDSGLIRRPSVAIVRSPNTCATTVFGACHTRKTASAGAI